MQKIKIALTSIFVIFISINACSTSNKSLRGYKGSYYAGYYSPPIKEFELDLPLAHGDTVTRITERQLYRNIYKVDLLAKSFGRSKVYLYSVDWFRAKPEYDSKEYFYQYMMEYIPRYLSTNLAGYCSYQLIADKRIKLKNEFPAYVFVGSGFQNRRRSPHGAVYGVYISLGERSAILTMFLNRKIDNLDSIEHAPEMERFIEYYEGFNAL